MSVSEGTGGDGRREAAEEAEEAEGGYRTKNKNPTRQCGEKLFSWVIILLQGGQRTTDTNCPTKTLSVRGDTESDQLHVPANYFRFNLTEFIFCIASGYISQEPARRGFQRFFCTVVAI